MSIATRLSLLLALFAACGVVEPGEGPGPVGQTTQGLAGIEGTFEFALDAPWRMEPTIALSSCLEKGCTPKLQASYDLVPVQISIHDADRVSDETRGGPRPTIGKVCGLWVTEGASVSFFSPSQFEEIESSTAWVFGSPAVPPRRVCSRTATSTCAGEDNLAGTSEWHAVVLYPPRATPAPGGNLPLSLELRVTRTPGGSCLDAANVYTLRNQVRVHYGEAPLPRFPGTWAYGDLHYHSQGTDNEGESAYNYRGVTRAMKALGLDFVWATEHASASEQFMDVDLDISGPAYDDVEIAVQRGVLRDMDDRRFRAMRGVAAAANADSIARNAGKGVVPQLFVGGELDAAPETLPVRGEDYLRIPWGIDKKYELSQLCGGWRSEVGPCRTSCDWSSSFMCCDALGLTSSSCDLMPKIYALQPDGAALIRDVQGVNQTDYFGREHLVYLPDPARADAFVASNTSLYGGGTRRLTIDIAGGAPALLPEVATKGGSVFAAHHLNASSGSSGPEGPPWSPSMLDQAFRHPAVLGLEFWNENARRRSTSVETGYGRDDTWSFLGNSVHLKLVDTIRTALLPSTDGRFTLTPFDVQTGAYTQVLDGVERTLTDGSASWDKLNLRGLDPAETSKLDWLPSGHPRRLFVAAGSDAHGDFNFRREGYMEGTSAVTDAALGTPRNLVAVPNRSATGAYTPDAVLAALRAGRFTATDGPAVRLVIDLNRNGVVDANEPTMGDVLDVPDLAHLATLPVLVQWSSTAEFGAVQRIELVVGAWGSLGTASDSRLYAGGCGVVPCTTGAAWIVTRWPDGWTTSYHPNGYFFVSAPPTPDPSGSMLALTMTPGVFSGTRSFDLDLAHLVVAPAAFTARATRLFVRAVVVTDRAVDRRSGTITCSIADSLEGKCLRRYALTNPVWVRDVPLVVDPPWVR